MKTNDIVVGGEHGSLTVGRSIGGAHVQVRQIALYSDDDVDLGIPLSKEECAALAEWFTARYAELSV